MKRINIKGPIISNDDQWIYDLLELEGASPNDIIEQLPDDGSTVEVIINSGGGDVYAGSEIYTMLRDYQGHVIIKVVGLAASAASVIAMAGDESLISPTAHLMIHNVSTIGMGDHNDFEKNAEVLSSHDKSIAKAYELKTGKSKEELLNLMNKETWMDADEALSEGFMDEIMFQEQAPQLVASIQTPVLPKKAVNKLKNFYKNSIEETNKEDKFNKLIDERLGKMKENIVNELKESLDDEENNKNNQNNQEPKGGEEKSSFARFFFNTQKGEK